MLYGFFASKTRIKLLRLFLKNPGKQYYLREICKGFGESVTPVRRELLNLKRIGLLKENRVANIIYYKVNRNFLLYEELSNMFRKTAHFVHE